MWKHWQLQILPLPPKKQCWSRGGLFLTWTKQLWLGWGEGIRWAIAVPNLWDMHSLGRKGAKFLTLLVQDCSIISLTLECQGCIHCIFLWYISQVELPYKRQDCALRNIWKGTWHIIFLRKDYDFLVAQEQK